MFYKIPIILSLFLFGEFNSLASEIKNNEISSISYDYLRRNTNNEYILGVGDKIEIIIDRSMPDLTETVSIDIEGKISTLRLKKIFISGLTIKELTALLNKGYSQYFLNPQVEIKLLLARPVNVFIKGEVEDPGFYTFIPTTDEEISTKLGENGRTQTLYNVIQKAGGITIHSDLTNIKVIRNESLSNGGGKKQALINLESLILQGDSNQNISIFDGDLIEIPKMTKENTIKSSRMITTNLHRKEIDIYVSGQVELSGKLTIPKSSTLNDAIKVAGGTKVIRGKISFVRFTNDGTLDNRRIRYSTGNKKGTYNNPILKNGDIIAVGKSSIAQVGEVVGEITTPLTGIFSTWHLFKLIDD